MIVNILIAHHYNLNNGDRAVLEATLQMIEKVSPQCKITVSAIAPKLVSDVRFSTVGWNIASNRIGRFKVHIYGMPFIGEFAKKHFNLFCNRAYVKAVEEADVVFISGGHHLTDILSSDGCAAAAAAFYVPIALGKKTIFLPQSIGPVRKEKLKTSIRYLLQNAYSVAYRDKSSEEFIKELNVKCKAMYVPDVVYSLKPTYEKKIADKTVGIALYHSYTGEKRDQILPFTIRSLIDVIDKLIQDDYSIKIIPMDVGDENVAQEIYDNLKSEKKSDRYYVADRGNTILDLISEFSGLSFVLAYKTHSTIFSMICETPLVAIAYHPKSIEFMRDAGLEEYAIDDKDASCDNLMHIIKKLENNLDNVRSIERACVNRNREAINSYFRGLEI